MAFQETRENIADMEKSSRPVSGKDMFTLLQFVIDDVYRLNHDLGQAEMEAGDQRELVFAIRGVLEESIQALEDNEEGLRQLTLRSQREYRELMKQTRERQKELDETRRALEAQSAAKERLDELCGKLDAEQARLREVEQECVTLEARAAKLDDNKLEAKEVYRDSLRAEVSGRERRNAALQTDIDSAERALAEARQEETQKTGQQQKLQTAVDRLTRRIAELDKEAAFLRGEEERLAKDILRVEQTNRHVLEMAEQYATLYTALNAALKEPVLQENLFTLSGSRETFSVEDIPDMGELSSKIESIEDLDHWAAGIQTRIEGLISIYQAQLRKLVELGDGLCSPEMIEED